MPNFESLEKRLDGWFSKSFDELPGLLKRIVIPKFQPFGWDNLDPDQRRSLAIQSDYQNDPAKAAHQEYWFNFVVLKQELESQLRGWEAVAAPTAQELSEKERRIAQLRQEIGHRNRLESLLMRRDFPRLVSIDSGGGKSLAPEKLISMPIALHSLAERLGSSKEEIAAWVYLSEVEGGLSAYKEHRYKGEFQRFYFSPELDHDYVGAIANCWFDECEIESFEPVNRYLSGAACVKVLEDDSERDWKVILADLIKSGVIADLHPIVGVTRASSPVDMNLPEFETSLLCVSQVEHALKECGMTSNKSLRPELIKREGEVFSERAARLYGWYLQEVAIKKSGALQRTADREGFSYQALQDLFKRAKLRP